MQGPPSARAPPGTRVCARSLSPFFLRFQLQLLRIQPASPLHRGDDDLFSRAINQRLASLCKQCGLQARGGEALPAGGRVAPLAGLSVPALFSSRCLTPASGLQPQGQPHHSRRRKAALTSARAAVSLWAQSGGGAAWQAWLPISALCSAALEAGLGPSTMALVLPAHPNVSATSSLVKGSSANSQREDRGELGLCSTQALGWGVGGIRKGKRQRHQLPFHWGLQPQADLPSLDNFQLLAGSSASSLKKQSTVGLLAGCQS